MAVSIPQNSVPLWGLALWTKVGKPSGGTSSSSGQNLRRYARSRIQILKTKTWHICMHFFLFNLYKVGFFIFWGFFFYPFFFLSIKSWKILQEHEIFTPVSTNTAVSGHMNGVPLWLTGFSDQQCPNTHFCRVDVQAGLCDAFTVPTKGS